MSVVALGSVRSCGVTTLCLALAAAWPPERRVLLVEADPAGGTLAAAVDWPPEPGLVSFAAATRRAEDGAIVFAHCHALPGGQAVLAAPSSGEQARRALSMLEGVLAGLGGLDADVLFDCGRLEPSAPDAGRGASNIARFVAADRTLLVVRPRLADLHALGSLLTNRAIAPLTVSGRLSLVLVGDGPYRDGEVEGALGVPVLGHVPFDPEAADALLAVSANDRVLRRAPLVRAARTLAEQLAGMKRPARAPASDAASRPVARRPPFAVLRQWRSQPVIAPNGAISSVASSTGAISNGASR